MDDKTDDYQYIDLYIDVDSTIINTTETFINYYCKKNNINKSFKDLKDWNLKSIDRNIDINELYNFVETEEFFNQVQFYDDFLKFYIKYADKYKFHFITLGTEKNLKLKKDFILNSLPTIQNVNFIGLLKHQSKNSIDMKNGIQIDDNYNFLNTNAKLKILLKNYIDTNFNTFLDIREDLYIAQQWKEIEQIILWMTKEINKEIII